MALETLFRTEEAFGKLNFVHEVRRDPELGQQVYLVDDEIENPDGKFYLKFLQALGDETKNQVGCFTFLKHQLKSTVSSDSDGLLGCAIDEQKRLLYAIYGGVNHDNSYFLKTFHLRYQAADKFGYRRIVVQEGHSLKIEIQLVCHEPPPFLFIAGIICLAICPATGQLVTGYIAAVPGGNGNCRAAVLPADLVYDQEEQTAVVKAVTQRLSFRTPLQMDRFELRLCGFSRSNHLLLWQCYQKLTERYLTHLVVHGGNQPDPDVDGCAILNSFTPGHPVNGHLNEMKIDPLKLVESLLPKSVFDSYVSQSPISNGMPKHMFFGGQIQLLGHVRKYQVFMFQNYIVLAAKWPKEWYRLSELPAARVSRVLRIDKEKKWSQINGLCLSGTDLYVKTKLGDAQVVRRLPLGHKFKDYRRCAFCAKEENKKKRNNDGKRMSKFMVCRMCKELNFHLFYSDPGLACHYCSDECQRKHWKQHKAVHNKNAKDRK